VGGSTSSGTSSLAVADVDGDRRDDIVQGDHVDAQPPPGEPPSGGEVRLWPGGRRGPTGDALRLTQEQGFVPGEDEPEDGFGSTVEAGDLDADGYADIVVGAPGENAGAGAVTVIRGGQAGIARAGHTRFFKGFGVPGEPVPGERFGWAIAALDLASDRRLDLAVTVREAARLRDAVFLIEGGKGAFAPDERRVSRLLRRVRGPWSKSVRIGRADGV
jgi:FG-GAP repeat